MEVQLKLQPYVKDAPEWEKTPIKVSEIIQHFETLNKEGLLNASDSRNESRSSGIVSDFDEDESLEDSSFRNSTSTPIIIENLPSSRGSVFNSTPLNSDILPKESFSLDDTGIPDDNFDFLESTEQNEIIGISTDYSGGFLEDDENENQSENNSLLSSLMSLLLFIGKAFTFAFKASVLLYLLGFGGYAAFNEITNGKEILDELVEGELAEGEFIEVDPTLYFALGVTLIHLIWYWKWGMRDNESLGYFSKLVQALFQPGFYTLLNKSNSEASDDDSSFYAEFDENSNFEEPKTQSSKSIFLLTFAQIGIIALLIVEDFCDWDEAILKVGFLPQLLAFLLLLPIQLCKSYGAKRKVK